MARFHLLRESQPSQLSSEADGKTNNTNRGLAAVGSFSPQQSSVPSLCFTLPYPLAKPRQYVLVIRDSSALT